MEVTCICGAKYKLSFIRIGQRDKDKLECDVCGQSIHSWNEGKIWTSKRIDDMSVEILKTKDKP